MDAGRATPLQDAAVLIPLVEAKGELPVLVLIHRSKHGLHGDQVSFPGGKIEPDDPTPVAAALREFEEELGADRDEVEVLESLPVIETRTTGYRVFPVLGRLRRVPPWSPDPREVVGVLAVPIRELLKPGNRGVFELPDDSRNGPRSFPYIQVGRHRIWGLTYRILEAGTGVEALKVWDEHDGRVDLLLTDMVMPEGMTGRDLARRGANVVGIDAGPLEHLEVLGDRRLAQIERLGQLVDRRLPLGKTRQDRAPRGVGEGREGEGEPIGRHVFNLRVKYSGPAKPSRTSLFGFCHGEITSCTASP